MKILLNIRGITSLEINSLYTQKCLSFKLSVWKLYDKLVQANQIEVHFFLCVAQDSTTLRHLFLFEKNEEKTEISKCSHLPSNIMVAKILIKAVCASLHSSTLLSLVASTLVLSIHSRSIPANFSVSALI